MEATVAGGAQDQGIGQAGLAAVGPVADMVGVKEQAMVAAGVAASAIADEQGALDGGWDGASLAADGEGLALVIDGDLDDAGVTGEAAGGLGADAGAAGQLGDGVEAGDCREGRVRGVSAALRAGGGSGVRSFRGICESGESSCGFRGICRM